MTRAKMEEYYLFTFASTHAAISTESKLKPIGAVVMPVPRFISASCGISLRIKPENKKMAEDILAEACHLSKDDFDYYHVTKDKSSGDVEVEKISDFVI